MPTELRGPVYRIQTPRLIIRCYSPGDVFLLVEAISASLDHLRPWMPWAAEEPEPLDDKIDRLRSFRGKFDLGQDFVYGIFNLEETQLLGSTGLHTRIGPQAREIGYWIHKDYINQGLATESSGALVRVAFEIDRVERVEIHCSPNNKRSASIPKKLGFTHQETKKAAPGADSDTPLESMIWTLVQQDYPTSPAAQAKIQAYDVVGRQLI